MSRYSKTLEDRLKQIVVDTNDCWLWQGSLTHDGYGHFGFGGKVVRAHRWFYEQIRGLIPVGLTLDHLCRVRRCVNPWHLEAVINKINVLRGNGRAAKAARQLYCVHGHKFSGRNGRQRICKECIKQSSHRIYLKNKENLIERKKSAARFFAYRVFPNPQPCERCGSLKADRHHENYDKPLEIVWLCRRCHGQHHAARAVGR